MTMARDVTVTAHSACKTARVLVERFRAGESVRTLAWDYNTTGASVENAIRWVLARQTYPVPPLEHKSHRGRRP